MSRKNDAIIDHIKSLPAGTKISVRNIAKQLHVSVSTAYKAIKDAEDIRLVETRDRAGTFRLKAKDEDTSGVIMLSDEICRLGLCVLVGEEYTNAPISRVIIADGSLEQFKAELADAGDNALCLIGDRIDVLFYAASQGANIVVTSGTMPSVSLLETAYSHKACVLSTSQDSSTVLSLLHADMSLQKGSLNAELADHWMRMPPFLYWDDMVTDWIQSYRELMSLSFASVVVDDDLHICGLVDPFKAMAAAPSIKLKNLYSAERAPVCADTSASMDEIAQLMIFSKASVVYITENDVLCGLVTALDVLRYYQYYSKGGTADPSPLISTLSSTSNRSLYNVQIDPTQMSSVSMNELARAAINKHCSEYYDFSAPSYSGSFYTMQALPAGDLIVSCEEKQRLPNCVVLELQVYNEETVFYNCYVTVINSESTVI